MNLIYLKSKLVLFIIVSFIIGLACGYLLKGHGPETGISPQEVKEKGRGAEKVIVWTCSMHPQIKQNGTGPCPICGMDLIPMKDDSGKGDKAILTLGERAIQLASVKTAPVIYKELTKSIYTVGKINYDEGRVAYVTSWVGGRIDKVYTNFTGAIVQKGQHLVYIYSPELVATQEEYLISYRGIKRLQEGTPSEPVIGSGSLLKNTRDRLILWGITEEQIKELERTQHVQTHLTIYAPVGGTIIHKNVFEGMYVSTGDRLFTIADLSRVWLYLDIYEYDIPWIRYGQDVEVTTESFPETTFHGTVVFIDPFLDETTRTVRVRVNMDNREGKLKPGMYANAAIKVKFGAKGVMFNPEIEGKYMCPMHPDIISDEPGDCSECGMRLELLGSRHSMFLSGLISQIYECPKGCPSSRSDKPGTGTCKECGTQLKRADKQETHYYTCEMHPEIRLSGPGNCPKCGMKLVKKEIKETIEPKNLLYVCLEHPEEQSETTTRCPTCHNAMVEKVRSESGVIAIPHSAVLYTGLRNIVYVEKEDGTYLPREVALGVKADDYYHVISGLELGERVVTSGNFLIDSQMQLLGKPSLLFPEVSDSKGK